mgnify:CR=1 FL=1
MGDKGNWYSEPYTGKQRKLALTKPVGGQEDNKKNTKNIDVLIMVDDLVNEIDKNKNRINPETIREKTVNIAPLGMGTQGLYGGKTFGGDEREIFRWTQGFPTEDRKEFMARNLIKQIEMNPDFGDTLTSETRPDIMKEFEFSGKPFQYLKHLFGKAIK